MTGVTIPYVADVEVWLTILLHIDLKRDTVMLDVCDGHGVTSEDRSSI